MPSDARRTIEAARDTVTEAMVNAAHNAYWYAVMNGANPDHGVPPRDAMRHALAAALDALLREGPTTLTRYRLSWGRFDEDTEGDWMRSEDVLAARSVSVAPKLVALLAQLDKEIAERGHTSVNADVIALIRATLPTREAREPEGWRQTVQGWWDGTQKNRAAEFPEGGPEVTHHDQRAVRHAYLQGFSNALGDVLGLTTAAPREPDAGAKQ